MRSRMHSSVSCSEVHQWALLWLMEAEVLKEQAERHEPTKSARGHTGDPHPPPLEPFSGSATPAASAY